ncbi:hypothetical protein [Deinococcus multiflagellatus]|uniref:Uncharacterized protein n=1 Tax=Deinococcus multiflagellatus TaxID=1656887 RepID=A0ABW1ZGC4_9DEIO|nr:hypothetical protein [Deinococcus multiflagellatus]MBZ9711704.1 hypothetical protein [Deinococcus multiflagellatus]
MSPDEWKAGIENEAHTAPDAAWARETRAHLRRAALGRQALQGGVGLSLGVATSAAVTLGTQWPVMVREAARNGVDTLTFLKWNILGNPQSVQTITSSGDSQLPVAGLLLALLVLANVAARLRVPHWVILLGTGAAVLTTTTLGNLVLPDFMGFPAYPLAVALGVAALGIVLGLPFSGRRARA